MSWLPKSAQLGSARSLWRSAARRGVGIALGARDLEAC